MKNSEQVKLEKQVDEYISARTGRWAITTLSTVRAKLRTVVHIGLDPVRLYDELSSQGYKPYSIQTYFTLARSFEKETRAEASQKIDKWMYSNRLKFQNCYKTKTTLISDEDMKGFLDAAKSDDEYNFLILCSKAGLRKSEAYAVNWSDIRDSELEVRSGKGGKQRFVPFNRNWLRSGNENKKVVTGKCAPELLPYTSHDLRTFYANKIVNMPGMNLNDAMVLLGHTNINTTAKYLRSDKNKRSKLILENL